MTNRSPININKFLLDGYLEISINNNLNRFYFNDKKNDEVCDNCCTFSANLNKHVIIHKNQIIRDGYICLYCRKTTNKWY